MHSIEDAKAFFTEFQKLFQPENPACEIAKNCYQNSSSFTDFIINRILYIIESFGFISQKEYFRIDAIGYLPRYTELADKNLNPHLWDLKIAVEHENDDKDWLDEIIKLAHICCPLRVVIGYNSVRNRDKDMLYLSNSADALEKLDCKYNLTKGTYMVILGNSRTKDPKEYFHYRAFVLQEKNERLIFTPLDEIETN